MERDDYWRYVTTVDKTMNKRIKTWQHYADGYGNVKMGESLDIRDDLWY